MANILKNFSSISVILAVSSNDSDEGVHAISACPFEILFLSVGHGGLNSLNWISYQIMTRKLWVFLFKESNIQKLNLNYMIKLFES